MEPEEKQTILLVDDNTVNLKILYETLAESGARLLIAQNVESALSIVRESKPDLVISDILMPVLTGFQFLEILKSSDETRDIPVLLMSALNDTQDKVKGFRLGAVDYITKPFQREEVVARVMTQLSLQRQKRQLMFFAQMDFLTSLYNRRFVLDLLEKEFERSKRNGSKFSVAIIDIDYFKNVNDEHGHLAGDEVLRRVAAEIKTGIRIYDTCGRYGGEEFLVLYPETDIAMACAASENIRKSIEVMVVRNGDAEISVTISVGVASFPDRPGDDDATPPVDAVIARADKAVYEAKAAGRNRVCAARG